MFFHEVYPCFNKNRGTPFPELAEKRPLSGCKTVLLLVNSLSRGTDFLKWQENARPLQRSLRAASARLPRDAGTVSAAAEKLSKFLKIVVDIKKYGWYYTEVASREAQQKSRRNAGSEGKMNLENRRSDSTDNPEIS